MQGTIVINCELQLKQWFSFVRSLLVEHLAWAVEHNFADPVQCKCHDDDFTFVNYAQMTCQKWDSNPQLQRRLQTEHSALDRSSILTQLKNCARVDCRFNFVKLVTEIKIPPLLTDASCFLTYGRLNVYRRICAALTVGELNPFFHMTGRDTYHYTNEDLCTCSYIDMSQNFDVYRRERESDQLNSGSPKSF